MSTFIAAILFALAVILDLAATSVGRITSGTLVAAGLFFLALHLAGYGAAREWPIRAWRPRARTYRRR
ncbi:MAG: hypothetical protein ACM3ML_31740 [Micromonosporaceae bacterium]